MEIERDLERIAQFAEEREDENWDFRSFLKYHYESNELDPIVHQLNEEISRQIDCTQCGNCCKQIHPVLDDRDVERFARGIGLSAKEFSNLHLIENEGNSSEYLFNKLPCPFLENNQCINYANRPDDCSSYPHLHKEGFISRLFGVIDNYSICPIVFNVYERLKKQLGYQRFEDYEDYDDDFDDDDGCELSGKLA